MLPHIQLHIICLFIICIVLYFIICYLSITKVEYVTTCEGAKECSLLSRLLNEICAINNVPVLYINNARALKLVKNLEYHEKSKNFDEVFH